MTFIEELMSFDQFNAFPRTLLLSMVLHTEAASWPGTYLIKSMTIPTRMWNMIPSPATPTVCLEQKSEYFKVQRDINVAVIISKIILFEVICFVAYYSAAKFTLPIEQPSNNAAKCGIRRSSKLKVKPNLGRRSSIAMNISDISVFV